MSDEFLTIRDISQLRSLHSQGVLRSPRALILELPGLSADEARTVSERLVSYANECGCALGAQCMAAGFVISIAWLALGHGILTAQFVYRLSWPLLSAFAGAGIGKAVGLVRARVRFNREIRKLISSQIRISALEV